jgi:hypothetical protein
MTITDTVSVLTKSSAISRISQAAGGPSSKNDKLKTCMRIWSGFTKFIRSQCNKERIIDSLFFGTFYKKTAGGDMKNPYVFVTDGARNMFNDLKLIKNDENFSEVPPDVSITLINLITFYLF